MATENKKEDKPVVLPNFVRTLTSGTGNGRTAEIMRDGLLEADTQKVELVEMSDQSIREAAYSALAKSEANRRVASTPKTGSWDMGDVAEVAKDVGRGVVYRNWDGIEKAVEKFTDIDFPDVPDYVRKDDSIAQDVGQTLGMAVMASMAASGVTSAGTALGMGRMLHGAASALGMSDKAATAMAAPFSRFFLAETGLFLAGESALEVGEGRAPDYKYGGVVELIDSVMDVKDDETPEQEQQRKDQYYRLSTADQFKAQLQSIWLDDLVAFGAFKVAGRYVVAPVAKRIFKKRFAVRGITGRGIKRANDILEFGNKRIPQNMSDADKEAWVVRALADSALKSPEYVKKFVKTEKGKGWIVVPKTTTSKQAEQLTPPPLPMPEVVESAAPRDILRVSPKLATRKLLNEASKDNTDPNTLRETLDPLIKELAKKKGDAPAGLAKETISENVARADIALRLKGLRRILKDEAADVTDLEESLAIIQRSVEKVHSGSGVELQSIQRYLDLQNSLNKLGMSFDDMRKLPKDYQDFVKEIYENISKGKLKPEDVIVQFNNKGPLKSVIHFLEGAKFDNHLGHTAILKTLLGNVTGTVDNLVKNTRLHGLHNTLVDYTQGTKFVARALSKGFTDAPSVMKTLWEKLSGQHIGTDMTGRMLIHQDIPTSIAGKLANAIRSTRMVAIDSVDVVTKAFNAQANARKSLSWATDYALRGEKNVTSELWEETYEKILNKTYHALKTGNDAEGVTALFHHFINESGDALAFRRNLLKAKTPISSKFYKQTMAAVRSAGTPRDEDTYLKLAGRATFRSILAPFAPTAINISERLTYSTRGLIGATKGLGYYGAKDATASGQSLALGGILFMADQLANTGVLTVSPPVTGSKDINKKRAMRGVGLPEGHFKVGNRSIGLDAMAVPGQFMALLHSMHGMINSFAEDDPQVAAGMWNMVRASVARFAPWDMLRNVGELVDAIGTEGENISAIKRIAKKEFEGYFPLGQYAKNTKEMHYQARLSGRELSQSPSELKDAMDSLMSVHDWVKTRFVNAYGAEGWVQRNYFGEAVTTSYPDEFGGDTEGFTNQVIRYLLGGTGVVDKEGIELYDKLEEIGVLDITGRKMRSGDQLTPVPYMKGLTPPSRVIGVDAPLADADTLQQGGEIKTRVKLPIHVYNKMKGLIGLQHHSWESHIASVDPEAARTLKRVERRVRTHLASYYDGKPEDTLKDIVKRVAMWDYEKRDNAPKKLMSMYLAMQYDPRYGGNDQLHTPRGLHRNEVVFNAAKRRTIEGLYTFLKKVGRDAILYDKELKDTSKEMRRLEGIIRGI